MIARGALAGIAINRLRVAEGLFAEELQSDNKPVTIMAKGLMKRRRVATAKSTMRLMAKAGTSSFASLFARGTIVTKAKANVTRRRVCMGRSCMAFSGNVKVNKRKTMRLKCALIFNGNLALFHRYLRSAPQGQGMIVPRDNRHMTLRGGNRKI